MIQFRFVGDPSNFQWVINPVPGYVYSIDDINRMRAHKGRDLDYLDLSIRENEWQEVFDEQTKPLHKDTDLGYFAGLALQGLLANPNVQFPTESEMINNSLYLAEELIKQLDNEVNL